MVNFVLCVFYHNKNKQAQNPRKLTDVSCKGSTACPSALWDEQVTGSWCECRGRPVCRLIPGKVLTSQLRVAALEPSSGQSSGQSGRAVSPCLCPRCVILLSSSVRSKRNSLSKLVPTLVSALGKYITDLSRALLFILGVLSLDRPYFPEWLAFFPFAL